MRIRVINPNTTGSMTETIGQCARAVAGPGTVIDGGHPGDGPGVDREPLRRGAGVPGLLAEIARGERTAPTGTSSPASATRAWTPPASWRAARWSASPRPPCTPRRSRPRVQRRHHPGPHPRPGLGPGRPLRPGRRLPGRPRLRDPGAGAGPDPAVTERIVALARAALAADGSDVIVLGCAGMADLRAVVSTASACRWSTVWPRRRCPCSPWSPSGCPREARGVRPAAAQALHRRPGRVRPAVTRLGGIPAVRPRRAGRRW